MALPQVLYGVDGPQMWIRYVCEYIEQALTDNRQRTVLEFRVEQGGQHVI
jgi:hypothetical protein